METLPLPLSFGTPPSPGSFDTPPSPATPPSSTSSGSVYKRELELELEPLPFELKLKSLSEGLEDVYLFRVESEVRVPSRSADRDVDGEVEMGDGGGEDGDEVGNMVVDGENEEDEETTPRLGSGRGRENGRMMRTTKLPYVDEDDVISLVFRRD
ncbi:hypothetical protein ONZ45_g13308 [Pleurotus djamor]|nr:hypothetical protein ONZ45_g13308 [Pleurotus djamor]